ncbi:MAG: molybdopterin-dependent oxidoreductase [Thermomicrobiales bacterium]|nr:molybdopterin-dependent oxidoreductase [Thermomicrobiales bacterium]
MDDSTRTNRTETRALFLSGCLATLVMLALSLARRGAPAGDPLIQLAAQTALKALPTGLFSFLLESLRSFAKPLLVVGVVVGMGIVGGGMALLQPSLMEVMTVRRRIVRLISMAIGAWFPLAFFVLLAEANSETALTNRSLIDIGVSSAIDAFVFALAAYLIYPALISAFARQSTRVDSFDQGRRRLLVGGATALVAISAGYLGKLVVDVRKGAIGGKKAGIPTAITPQSQFYVVSKNVLDPDPDVDRWALHISGLVANPMTLAYVDLAGMASVEQPTTLTCISNKIGGDLVSNGVWRGVRLVDLLTRAGVQPDAVDLALYAADGYTESIPVTRAMGEDVLLAVQLNGEPLNATHGAPARLIVPGKYGIKNVKWIERIDLVAGDFRGYWQQRGWTEDGTIQTFSRIDLPSNRAVVERGAVELGGIAYAGDRGITAVELSFDGGTSWQAVDEIQQISALSWVIWRSTWNAQTAGAYRVLARATDGNGEVQTSSRRDPIPSGATGYHSIEIGVI